MDYKPVIKKIDKHKKSLSEERDNLDSYIQELKELEGCLDAAIENLEYAREALSEVV